MSDQFTSFIAAKISQLQRGYLNNEAMAVRTMAHLRKATNRAPGTDPELWTVTLEDLPTAHQGRGHHASAAEWASHISLSLYAVHQQGKKSKGMHEPSVRFGRVVRGLSDHGMSPEAVKRRFDALATASSPLEVQHHLGALVRILRDADASIDYVRLADDLRRLLIPGLHKPVLLQWGRDFAYSKPPTPTTSSEQPAAS
jgi:CRISPR system Cascade subunit CasB